MDRFPSMHDDDIDKLGIRRQGPHEGEESWKRRRKRARELSVLQGKLDRASEKEQQSWEVLEQALKGGGCATGEGRFKATESNKGADELRERTVGLVTAAEFRKAKEAADTSAKAAEEEMEVLRRKAEKKKRKAAEKKKRLQKSTMSFSNEEDDDVEEANEEDGAPEHATPEERSASEGRQASSHATKDGIAEKTFVDKPGVATVHEGSTTKGSRDGEERDMKGAAADEKNSDAASRLRVRLGL